MKLANVSWGWTPIPEDMPHGDSLIRIADQIRELGFEGVDYLGTPEALDEFFTEEACRALGDHSRSIGLEPNVFVFQDASWNDACSEKREDSVRHFEKAAQAAKWIGCRIVSTLVPMPCGATPWKFNPAAPAIKQGYHMPADYCYQKDWDTLMDSYRKCLAIAKRYGLRMSVECFPYSMISTPHAMLQLLKDVDDPDFGIQLDTNHLIMQHIDPEWTIYMLGGKRIFNVHCKDSDAVSRNNIPAGCGITDYPAVIQALKNVGYDGNLSVELEFTDNPRRYNKQAMLVGVSSRKSSLIRVDFPEPLSPTIKTNSPFLIVRLTLSKAGEPLEYDLLTRSSVMTASEPSRFFFFFLSFCTKPCHHPNIQKIPCTSCTLQP